MKTMRLALILLFSLLLFVLCACGGESVSPAATADGGPVVVMVTAAGDPAGAKSQFSPTPAQQGSNSGPQPAAPRLNGTESFPSSPELDALEKALLLEITVTEGTIEGYPYYDRQETSSVYYLDDIWEFLGDPFNEPFQILRYAFVDLNQDGTPEALVELSAIGDVWYKVLHYDQGTVYGYSFVARAFEAPNIGGGYVGSDGAADNYYLHLSFTGSVAKETVLAQSVSDWLGENYVIHYYLNGAEVPESEFRDFESRQNSIDSVTWYDYSTDLAVG